MKSLKSFLLFAASLCTFAAQAAPAAPDLDLGISFYSKIITEEGVTRESRYEERWLRRTGHVWVERVLPQRAKDTHEHKGSGHRHFNPTLLARHVTLEDGKLKLEYVDAHARERIAVPPGEYGNVSFNGSWDSQFYLVAPKMIAELPLSTRVSNVPGARWREREKNGQFQRVLWDDERQIALVIESGDRAGQEFQRIEARPSKASAAAPWNKLAGYSLREYADFLD